MNKIGVDIDGVIYDWHGVVYRHFVEEKNFAGSFQDFWGGYFHTLSEDYQEYLTTIPTYYEETTPIFGAINFLHWLNKNYTIYYISSRPKEVERVTEKYFKRLNIPQGSNLYLTNNKEFYIRLFQLDYHVDDSPKVIDCCKNLTCLIVKTTPWNLQYMDGSLFFSSSFKEIQKFIEEKEFK